MSNARITRAQADASATVLVERLRLAYEILADIGRQSSMAATVREGAAALEAARVDAARYQFIRECTPREWDKIESALFGGGEGLDAAIDAAIAAGRTNE